ncbi:ABC transporter F family member 4 [Cyclospora cayetanensis]|uniref:ABC transporter F family member 4 n=1 Tax=Cyclospora cayetanensis TaxID=88456 RepID=A0A6P6RVM6_9EIME|nr:ABC transporter F family member 4 [Cyclospora cayetanensis]
MSNKRRSGAARRAKRASVCSGGGSGEEPSTVRDVSTQQGTTQCEDDEAVAFDLVDEQAKCVEKEASQLEEHQRTEQGAHEAGGVPGDEANIAQATSDETHGNRVEVKGKTADETRAEEGNGAADNFEAKEAHAQELREQQQEDDSGEEAHLVLQKGAEGELDRDQGKMHAERKTQGQKGKQVGVPHEQVTREEDDEQEKGSIDEHAPQEPEVIQKEGKDGGKENENGDLQTAVQQQEEDDEKQEDTALPLEASANQGNEAEQAEGEEATVAEERQEEDQLETTGSIAEWTGSEAELSVAASADSTGLCCTRNVAGEMCEKLFIRNDGPYGPLARNRVFREAQGLVFDRIPSAMAGYVEEAQQSSVAEACLTCSDDVCEGCKLLEAYAFLSISIDSVKLGEDVSAFLRVVWTQRKACGAWCDS